MQKKIKIPAINIATDIFLMNKDWDTPLKKIMPLLAIIFYCIPFGVKGYKYLMFEQSMFKSDF